MAPEQDRPDQGSTGVPGPGDTSRLAWDYLAHSEIGLVRKNNQDSGLVSASLLLVADGMGGAAAGDLASAVAVDTIAGIQGRDEPDRLRLLAGAISAANTRIADLVATDYTLEGMGTTVTAAMLDRDAVGLAHIGDSRAYLFTGGRLEQITHDHSWVQSLIDEGKLSEQEAAGHPHRSLLLRVLNGQPSNEPDLSTVPLRPGDRLLLCSDGLCGFVDHDDIAAALAGTSRELAMSRLVAAAHTAGGLDNITIIIADVYDAEQTATRIGAASVSENDGGEVGGPALDGAGQEVSGPLPEGIQLIGAAAERDVAAAEEEVRRRVADREAEQEAYDLDDEDDDHTDIEDEDRYAPQAPTHRRWRRPLLLSLALLLVIVAGAAAGYSWTRTQYYVGAADDRVAIYQGLSESIPGIPLSRVYEVQQLPLTDLPVYYQGLVRATINTGTLESARATVQQLKETAARCGTQGSGNPTPAATASGSARATARPTATATSATKPSSRSSSTAGRRASAKPGHKPSSGTSPTAARPAGSASATAPGPSATSTSAGQLPGDPRC